MMFREGKTPKNIPAVLHQIVNERLQQRSAVLRGEVLGREGLVIPDTNFVGVYATVPVYYPSEMWVCKADGADVILCWLLPITNREWRFISQNGWSEFEAVLDHAQFDLFDLNRPDVV